MMPDDSLTPDKPDTNAEERKPSGDRPVDRSSKIYTKTGASQPGQFETARHLSVITGTAATPGVALAEAESSVWPELELQRAADRIVLARFGPPGLVVDHRMNVLQSRGQVAPFLEITPGAVNWSLLRVIKEVLVAEVRTTLQRAMQENVPASTIARFSDEQAGEQAIQIDVLPITSASSRPRCYLILFQPMRQEEVRRTAERFALPQLAEDEKDRMIAHLRQDLTTTRFHLQSLVGERDAQNQELVSANEEIQSANEELQSTNKELEATKEKLQSANEELQAMNDELHQRNDVLTQTGNDLTNLLNSVNIPLLMLTSDLRIRQFTPPMQKLLSVRRTDIGRSINEIRLQLSVEDLEPILIEVLETLGTRELEVQDKAGRWYLLRVRPYRTSDNKIEGLVVALFDIDVMRRSQQSLKDARDYSNAVVESVPVPIVVLNSDNTIRTENSAFRKMADAKAGTLSGPSFPDLVARLWGVGGLTEKLNKAFEAPPGTPFEYEHSSTTADHRSLLMNGRVVQMDDRRALLLVVRDVTLQRDSETLGSRKRKELQDDLDISSRTLGSTQLELRELNAYLFKLQEEERERVARELHDDVSQRLSLLELLLNEVRLDEVTDGSRNKILSAREQIGSLNTDVRQISHRLHPAILKDLGLSAALKALVTEFGERENMPVTFLTQNLPEGWSSETATAIYRIAQEALRNIAKHAGKTHVKVVLCGEQDRLQLKVMDFGIGFDQEAEAASPGLGMISMQERARLAGGTIKVNSQLGEGTTVMVDVPVKQHA